MGNKRREIIIGTGNLSKIDKIKYSLSKTDVVVIGINEVSKVKLDIKEVGKTAVENARIKARAYSRMIGKPVLSTDAEIYIDGLSDEEQPGTRIKRINEKGEDITDEELINYYSAIVDRLGGKTTEKVTNAFCIATPDGRLFETTITSIRHLVSKPSEKRVNGRPQDSLQVDPETGKYLSEMTEEEKEIFWRKIFGEKFTKFIKRHFWKLENSSIKQENNLWE